MEIKYFMYRNETFRVWKQNVSYMETKRFMSRNEMFRFLESYSVDWSGTQEG